jgi:hypothetical protein
MRLRTKKPVNLNFSKSTKLFSSQSESYRLGERDLKIIFGDLFKFPFKNMFSYITKKINLIIFPARLLQSNLFRRFYQFLEFLKIFFWNNLQIFANHDKFRETFTLKNSA